MVTFQYHCNDVNYGPPVVILYFFLYKLFICKDNDKSCYIYIFILDVWVLS